MSRQKFIIVGLTGPTGSGKSTVCSTFLKNGCAVIDADKLAREAVQKGTACLKQLCMAFGDDILNPDGELNRKALAAKAFSTAENTRLLNDITHPSIIAISMQRVKQLISEGYKIIVFDAPTLFESNTDIMCRYIVTVTAPQEVRLSRIMERDGITTEQARLRMKAQHDDVFYTDNSDFVINNDADVESTIKNTEMIIKKIKEEL